MSVLIPKSVLILDCETTSVRPDREPIEIGYITLRACSPPVSISTIPGGTFCRRYKPERPISWGSMAVHGIFPEDLEDCPLPSSFALPEGVDYIIGHNADFDWQTIGSPPVNRICTLAMARELWPHADSHTLGALLLMLHGPTNETRAMLKDSHSALADCDNTLLLLGYILAAKPEILSWHQLWEFSEKARIPKVMPMGKNKGTPIIELEDGEIQWYLDRDFIDAYLRKAFEMEMGRRARRYQDQAVVDADGDDHVFEDDSFGF